MSAHARQTTGMRAAVCMAVGLLILPGAATAQSLLEPLPERSSPQAVQATPTPAAASAPADAGSEGAGSAQRLSQLFYQLQVLQQEVQDLRGLVEEQSHQIDRLARDQQEQYIDLDRRISQVTTGGGAAAGGGGPLAGGGVGGAGASAGTTAGPSGGGSVAALPSPATTRTPESERDAYTHAFELMKARQFDESAAAFNQLIADYPNGQYTPNAYYWLGELYLAQTQIEQARQAFSQVLNLYPDHPKVPDTLYKMGVVYHRMGDNARALAYFRQVQSEYPDSSAAGLATRYMAELQ
jgi:tol-pal system protein YbgF